MKFSRRLWLAVNITKVDKTPSLFTTFKEKLNLLYFSGYGKNAPQGKKTKKSKKARFFRKIEDKERKGRFEEAKAKQKS